MAPHPDYRIIEDSYYIFHNHIPDGPIKLLSDASRIIVTYTDYNNKIQCSFGNFNAEEYRLAYFSAPGDNLEHLLHLVSACNSIISDITFFCQREYISLLKKYCNSHIRLIDTEVLNDTFSIELDCVIASSPAAIYFIRQQIPVIVAGPAGFGGWVTPQNFDFFCRSGFRGRPGGVAWELIPPPVFLDELGSIKDALDREETLSATAILAKSVHFTPQSGVEGLIDNIRSHLSKIQSPAEKWNLVPSIASNIELVQGRERSYIKRRGLNDTIGIAEDLDFLSCIDGKRPFIELCSILAVDDASFWDYMHMLIHEKIIVY